MTSKSLLLAGLLPLFVACGGSVEAPGEADTEQGEQEVKSACGDHFAAVEAIRKGIPWDNKVQGMPSAYFIDAIGIDLEKTNAFVYKSPAEVADLKKKGADLKATLTGTFKPLVASVDAVLAAVTTYNLQGRSGAEIATSFRCLSSVGQHAALKDATLTFEEKALDLTTSRAKPLYTRVMKDVDYEQNVWGDTILEGGYVTEGDVTLRDSTEIRLAGKRVALAITFGSAALISDACEQNADESWPKECPRGDILQTIYFDTDLKRIEPHEEGPDFYEN